MSTTRRPNFSSGLRLVATIVTLLVVFSTLVAGVIDTKSRVSFLERDQGELRDKFERRQLKQMEQYDAIKDALHDLKLGQAILRQRLEDLDFMGE